MIAFLAIIALLVLAPPAHANGDPASDVLLSQDHFLPYAPEVQDRLATALEDVLEDADAAGYPMKVALIASERDLGAYPQLFNQPQEYADLLTQNLALLNPHGDAVKNAHVLVVMPGGFGGNNLGEAVDDALGPITIQSEASSDGLAKAAVEAVARVATVNGHKVPVPPEADLRLDAASAADGGGPSPLLYVAPALLLFAGLAVAGRVSARRAAGEPD